MITTGNSRLISIGDAAALLGLSRSTLYKYVETGSIPHVKIGGRIRFEPDSIESWIAARRVPEESL